MAKATLLTAARRAGLRVGHPCRALGVCGRCTVEVVEGAGTLPPPDEDERALLAREKLGPRDRIACRVRVAPGTRVVLRAGGAEVTVEVSARR